MNTSSERNSSIAFRLTGITRIALLFAVAAMLALQWAFNRPPVAMHQLAEITKGASKETVRTKLGEPTDSYERDRKWAYSRMLGWSIVCIYFDEHGRFDRYDYDY